jgi:hypothetical protein
VSERLKELVMKWNLIALASALALAASGCITNDSPIRILGARPLDSESCDALDVLRVAGSLDISARGSYYIQLDMESDLQSITTTSGGTAIADGSRNNFYGNEIVLTYTSTPSLNFEVESVPLHFVVEPNAEAFIRMSLVSDKAARTLANAVLLGDTVDLRVQLEFRGVLASGQKLRSNSIIYPITVFNSGFAGCNPATEIVVPNGPCGSSGGQDGARALCCLFDPGDRTKCQD